MTKYNKSEIFKNAWRIFKKKATSFSSALVEAWAIAKDGMGTVSYEVKQWFADKIANEIKRNIYSCDVFAIIKETEKAVYAMLDLGYDFPKTMWVPKSVLIAHEVGEFDCIIYKETYRISDYEAAKRMFFYKKSLFK